MPDVTELIDELIDTHHVPRGTAYRIAGRLLEIGAGSALARKDTPDKCRALREIKRDQDWLSGRQSWEQRNPPASMACESSPETIVRRNGMGGS